jgi:hypothetical protein
MRTFSFNKYPARGKIYCGAAVFCDPSDGSASRGANVIIENQAANVKAM